MRLKNRIILIAVLSIAFSIQTVSADWDTYTITSGADDGVITTTGGAFFDSYYVAMIQNQADLQAYYAFRGLTFPVDTKLKTAILEFEGAPAWNYNQSCPATVYGLGVPDLDTWNSANYDAVDDLPSTIKSVDYDLNLLHSGNKINITVTEIVSDIITQYGWTNGNDIGFRSLAIALSGSNRWALAYESGGNVTAKLYIETEAYSSGSEEYRGYIITITPAGKGMPMQILTNTPLDQTNTLLVAKSQADMSTANPFNNYTVPFGIDVQNSNNQIGEVYNDTLYMIGQNATNAVSDVWSAPLSDLTAWTWRGSIDITAAGATDSHWMLINTIDEVLHYFEIKQNGIWWSSMYLSNYTVTAPIKITVGNAAGVSNGVSAVIDSNGGIHVAGAHGQLGSTVNRVFYAYKEQGQAWSAQIELPSALGTYYALEPNINVFGGYVHIFYLYGIGTNIDYTDYVNMAIGDVAFSAPIHVISDDGYIQGKFSRTFIYEDFFVGNWNNDVLVFMTQLPEPNPKEIAYIYVYQTAPTAFTSTDIPDESAGYCNYTANIFPAVWDFGGRQAYTAYVQLGASVLRKSQANIFNLAFWGTPQQLGSWDGIDVSTAPDLTTLYQTNFAIAQSTSSSITVVPPINGTPPDPSCLALAVTLEDVEACIDAVIGQDPSDPNPPGSNYPPDGKGALTRFNIRMYIWLIGHSLVMIPFIVMAYKRVPFEMYLYFSLCIVFGFGLIWTMGSI